MKKIKILVIGKNSLLAKNYQKLSKIVNTDFISRHSLSKLDLKSYSHIINFCIEPDIYKHNYNLKNVLDKKICSLIKNTDTIYVMPSSRLVYSKNVNYPISEKTKKYNSNNIYGKNKKKIENIVRKELTNNYLILRISTILLFDISKRRLFISTILRNLKKKNKIYFDISPDSFKDFITIELFTKMLDNLIKRKETGIFNLSSGIPVKICEILKKIISGYGRGKIKYSNEKKKDSYVLNNKKLKKKYKFSISKNYILNYCKKIGERLLNE